MDSNDGLRKFFIQNHIYIVYDGFGISAQRLDSKFRKRTRYLQNVVPETDTEINVFFVNINSYNCDINTMYGY